MCKDKGDFSKDTIVLEIEGLKTPAMSLESELDANKTLGRIERVRKIEEVLRKRREG